MGGGTTTVSAYYGSQRKTELSQAAIRRTAKEYKVKLDSKRTPPRTKVISEKIWQRKKYPKEAAAFYRKDENTLYIRRKYFAGIRTQTVVTHEIVHSISGERIYKKGVSSEIEEGTTEYITQGTQYFGYKGRGKKYSKGYQSYAKEVKSVAMLMEIIGRKEFLRMWKKGFKTEYVTLAQKIRKKGYKRTANIIESNYMISSEEKPIYEYVREDVKKENLELTLGIFPYEDEAEFRKKKELIKEHEEKLRKVY